MRGDYIKSHLENNFFAVQENYFNSILKVVNSDSIDTIKAESNAIESACRMEVIDNKAIIHINGAMIARHNFMSTLCGDFVSYGDITRYIQKAEADKSVDTIIFKVNTVGGDVEGADEVGELIKDSTKKTITYFNHIGASAGMWIFSASDTLVASDMTFLGSIGVIATYRDRQESTDTIKIVSQNAQNKDCSLNGDCKSKIQDRINQIESVFYSRLTRNTKMSKEQLNAGFKNGDVIIAEDALKLGFLDKITSFSTLLSKFNNGDKTMSKQVDTSAKLDAIKAELELAKDQNEKLRAEINTLKSVNATNSDEVAEIVAMAFEYGATKDQTLKMITMSKAESALFLLKAKKSGGTNLVGDTESKEPKQEEFLKDDDIDSILSEVGGI
jgi:protease-4